MSTVETPVAFPLSRRLGLKADRLIPGGAHTYSKGRDQFPDRAPDVLVRAKGCRTWDADGNEFIDWGMGLRSVILGHAYEPVLEVVRQQLELGVNFTRPSVIEAETAERLVDSIPCAEMARFAKNGSDVTSAALRLARAYTGRKKIAFCKEHPFFSFDDWFIGTTPCSAGIPEEHVRLSLPFKYNELATLEKLFQENPGQIAAVMLEMVTLDPPREGFLEGVRKLCTEHGAVLIFDEMITGLRFHPQGAQAYFKVTPDLATFGKAIGNGFSVAALVGRRDIMELGGLKHKQRRCFLLSATHGGETHALAACGKTLDECASGEVARRLWQVGAQLQAGLKQAAADCGFEKNLSVVGYPCSPGMIFRDENGQVSMPLRTLYLQEMIARGVLIPYIAPSFAHDDASIQQTIEASAESLAICKQALDSGTVRQQLAGEPTRPVFREFN